MLQFSTDQWIIVLLVFLLGLFIGGFIFSGGGRKWKTRYNNEVERREEVRVRRHGQATGRRGRNGGSGSSATRDWFRRAAMR